MTNFNEENLGRMPSPQTDAEVRYALALRFSMLKPIYEDVRQAGFSLPEPYESWLETIREPLFDPSTALSYYNIYIYQLLIQSVYTQESLNDLQPILRLLKDVFANFGKEGKIDLEKVLEDLQTKLTNLDKEVFKKSDPLPDAYKEYIDSKFKALDEKLDPFFASQKDFSSKTDRTLGNWEGIRKQVVRDYSESFLKADKLLKEIPEEWEEIIKLILELIGEELIEEFASRVVGMSYSRWDNTANYYPTVTFIFREVTEGNKPRTSQIQLKWKRDPASITDAEVTALKLKIEEKLPITYNHGTIRSNYVQKDKSWKTTIFCDSKTEALPLLRILGGFLGEQIEPNQFSYTESGNRATRTRRREPLDGITPEFIDYQLKFPVELYRAVLMINGLRKPLRLYQKPKKEEP